VLRKGALEEAVSYISLNRHELLFESKVNDLEADRLPLDENWAQFFYGADFTPAQWKSWIELCAGFDDNSQPLRNGMLQAQIKIDSERIERQMLEKSVCKARLLV